jgi:hypothetical protein
MFTGIGSTCLTQEIIFTREKKLRKSKKKKKKIEPERVRERERERDRERAAKADQEKLSHVSRLHYR